MLIQQEIMMAKMPGNVEWVAELIPGMEGQLPQFVVATDEVDDELIEIFIEELVRLTGELQEGFQNEDPDMVRVAAHSIKGMGGTIGLPEISVLALTIENAAKEERLADCAALMDGLVNWLQTLA
jgi:HPt (histidine-containing phosphotransfer) domain-containing protein